MESDKKIYLVAVMVGSVIGGYIPTFLGFDIFSLWSVVGGAVGAALAVYICYKIIGY
jgi:uncharacterized membrane protein YeaQ/YmgE (transglycosylase-associated protein family)